MNTPKSVTLSFLPIQAQPAPGIGAVIRVGQAYLSFLPHQLGERDVALEGVWCGSLAVIDPHTHSHPMGESFSFIAERSRKPQREMGRGKAFWKFPVPSLQGGQASTNLSHMTQAVTELSLG